MISPPILAGNHNAAIRASLTKDGIICLMSWWGQFTINEKSTALWELGPLRLAARRIPDEWRLHYEWIDVDEENEIVATHRLEADSEAPDYQEFQRYVFSGSDNTFYLLPALADRPVVSRPLKPFTIPTRQEAAFYVSTPLWAHIQVEDSSISLQYIPIYRPSETWFGPSTMEGEFCYASRTFGRLNLSEIPIRPYRSITKVLIRNPADSPLLVERLSLPVPYLSLYAGESGQLWTEGVSLVRGRDTVQADLQINRRPPDDAPGAELVAGPRESSTGPLSIRAFGAMFRDATRWS